MDNILEKNLELANLIFPNITNTIEDLEKISRRDLQKVQWLQDLHLHLRVFYILSIIYFLNKRIATLKVVAYFI